MKRAKNVVNYHGRSGHPYVHENEQGKRYIMVRSRGGGTKRLYEGARYSEFKGGKANKRLKLVV